MINVVNLALKKHYLLNELFNDTFVQRIHFNLKKKANANMQNKQKNVRVYQDDEINSS